MNNFCVLVIISILFSSCSGGGGDTITNVVEVPVSESVIDSSNTDENRYNGEYIYVNSSSSMKYIFYISFEGNKFIKRLYSFPYPDDLSIAKYIESSGIFSDAGDGNIKVIYENELCESVGEEIVGISINTDSVITLENETIAVSFDKSTLDEFDVSKIKVLAKDIECENNDFFNLKNTLWTQSSVLLPSESDDDSYDDSDLPSYYDIPPISGGEEGVIVHGTAYDNRNPPPDGIFWSSERNMSTTNQEILKTDSRFNIRLMALSGASQNTVDSNGITCGVDPVGYQQLQVNVCVRKKDGACVYMHSFTELDINEWSLTKEFNIPSSTDDPLVIEVLDVKWDFSCTWDGTNNSSYCPFAAVWDKYCVRFKMQVSTDGTQDLPGGRF